MNNTKTWVIIGAVVVVALLIGFYMTGSSESVAYESTAEVGDVSLEVGTPESEAIDELAKEVEVTGTKDEEGTAEIDWEIEDYEAETPGDYSATGELTLPENWSGSPDDVETTVTVEGKGGNYQALKEKYMEGCSPEGELDEYCECTFDYIYEEEGMEALMEEDQALFEEAATECIHLYEE